MAANLSLIIGATVYIYNLRWVRFYFFKDVGELAYVEIRKRDLNPQSLSNIVSSAFYNGGKIPDNVRKQIIDFTLPKTRKGGLSNGG